MCATVNSKGRFTVAFTVAVVTDAECDSKKRLREIYCRRACASKLAGGQLLSQGGFRAIDVAPEKPATR